MYKKVFLLTALLYGLTAFSLSAQEELPENISVDYHIKGDQVFSIEAGLFIPISFLDFSPEDSSSGTFSDTQLSVGGLGFLSYTGYLNNNIRVGAEAGGIFAYSPNMNLFSFVPIMLKGVYDIYLNREFTIPVSLSAGVAVTSYLESYRLNPVIVTGVGFLWNQSSEWSYGIKYNYMFVAEIYKDKEQYNLFGNFSEIRLVVERHY